MSKLIPLIFSPPMVLADREGRKTMTRRIVKLRCDCGVLLEELPNRTREGWQTYGHSGRWQCPCCSHDPAIKSPFGIPGDRLWVREGLFRVEYFSWKNLPPYAAYTADGRPARGKEGQDVHWRWKPKVLASRYMPKEACRAIRKGEDSSRTTPAKCPGLNRCRRS